MARELDRMTYDEVEGFLTSGSGILLVPVGSTEEHGTHGPLGTDTFTARIVCRKVAELIDAVVAPALPYGMACDQANFKGTVTLRPMTLSLVVKELCENFARDGYRLVLFISGHRGNDHPCITGVQEAAYNCSTHFLYMSYQDANRGRLREVLGDAADHVNPDDLKYGADGHGGSTELSIAMAHAKGSVKLDKRKKPDRHLADAIRSFPFKAVLNMEEFAPTDGFFGDPGICSEELGERIADSTASRIASEVLRYLEIFPARTQRIA
ncbi:creatininase family protein [Aquabacter spiritensis]|uniref:Creatinine amidohydrolase n=1 Tax=Aquabacter spiritensis TaxID=933073 RepID=A0A4R3LY47_9HYPH|nr:creatininase family protein [Aquabacter spiritensis]TCT03597.1 creatinine amidohydrolase [Aquabacter spiritensis]